MVFIYDGDMLSTCEIKTFWNISPNFAMAFDLKKCPQTKNTFWSLYTRASISELPFDISSMVWSLKKSPYKLCYRHGLVGVRVHGHWSHLRLQLWLRQGTSFIFRFSYFCFSFWESRLLSKAAFSSLGFERDPKHCFLAAQRVKKKSRFIY